MSTDVQLLYPSSLEKFKIRFSEKQCKILFSTLSTCSHYESAYCTISSGEKLDARLEHCYRQLVLSLSSFFF